jgi:hypothetical protein
MTQFVRIALISSAAALVLAVGVGSASATRLSFSRQSFRIVWSGLAFKASTGERITCHLTVEGTFHSTIFAKTVGAQLGVVTRANIGECREQAIVLLTSTLPWGVEYTSFIGTLPQISQITMYLTGLAISWGAIFTCLMRTEETSGLLRMNAARNTTTGQLTRMDMETGSSIRLTGGLCTIPTMSLEGSGTVTILGEGEGIFVRLI